jgi:thiamine pyrophosphate-dependent acetolactate synthase large subunit-like protein
MGALNFVSPGPLRATLEGCDLLLVVGRGRRFVAMDLTDPDLRFDRMAEAMGVRGRRVERPEEIAPALREAIAHDGPSLVDVALEGPVPMP